MNTDRLASSLRIGALVVLVGACSTARSRHERRRRATSSRQSAATSITLGQVDEKALEQPAGSFGSMKLSQALYEARRAAADELVGNLLLDQEAKRLGIDRDEADRAGDHRRRSRR